MAEAGSNGSRGQEVSEPKTFTQEQVDAIIGDRLARANAKYADYEDLKAKADKFDKMEEANKTERQKAQDKAAKLEEKVKSMEKADQIRTVRAKVAEETGVPQGLLTGEDEETCKNQAENILKFAKGSRYPGVKEEKHSTKKTPASDAVTDEYREFAGQVFGQKE